MEGDRKRVGNGGGCMSVPAFGEWDNMQGVPDYSMDFTKIREMKKQSKQDISRVSVGNEAELVAGQHHHPPRAEDAASKPHAGGGQHQVGLSPNHSARKRVWNYFYCCVRRA